ncbi:hypothetical protein L861_17010 [Litchfieldella anticariensis FP35 = DSM 16096]|uniref:Uncharacterized protein n=1 Tax=Litchfieldella anticariensis (strain DSM 16096 / CECT 5854 / CIP 108499 / LMG 22089 / FP35) TaxID=1121939 RepID=S2KHG7_LITA3|nr:hypothetical protein L861_17010 [Halomonas anticariensis FP35 = DSM 16096]
MAKIALAVSRVTDCVWTLGWTTKTMSVSLAMVSRDSVISHTVTSMVKDVRRWLLAITLVLFQAR